MKRVTINAYQMGLVFKNGVYQRLLREGKYWLSFTEKVEIYDRTKPFTPALELNLLLKDEQLKDALHLVEVKDNDIVLQYVNGLLNQVLTAGRYAYWKGIVNYDFVTADTSKIGITENIDRATLTGRLLAGYVRTANVEAYEKAVLFVDGKYDRTLESGFYCWWKNNIIIYVGKVDMRLQQAELNGQEILTRDKASLRINAWARYQVVDIEKALLQNKEFERQLYVAFQLALREYITGLNFDELLEKKDAIVPYILEKVAQEAETLGVKVAGFGIRDIILPGDVKEIMNQVLVAEKKAQANIILRREETASTRSLLNTAKLLEDNPMLYKLKELEYVEKIAEKVSTISVNGNGVLIDQLRQIFSGEK
ncbi:slipin family protein [Puia dinghuensis]|uniref:Peptidase n=1 Tax=Puia dinghuensis TaxID=1792502 RepID=A0A8J2UG68_9BACT|nr:slipin family protein [Puia dinghuensis]GGB12974.1 peptidase [Puia dinghuensis]